MASEAIASDEKQQMTRNTLCSLEFGKFNDKNEFIGSTPIQDACNIKHRETRIRVCNFNYKDKAVINACIATYDAISFQLKNIYQL
jgi:hypothetical protein